MTSRIDPNALSGSEIIRWRDALESAERTVDSYALLVTAQRNPDDRLLLMAYAEHAESMGWGYVADRIKALAETCRDCGRADGGCDRVGGM